MYFHFKGEYIDIKISQFYSLKYKGDIAVMLSTLGLGHSLRLLIVQRQFLSLFATESIQSHLMPELLFCCCSNVCLKWLNGFQLMRCGTEGLSKYF